MLLDVRDPTRAEMLAFLETIRSSYDDGDDDDYWQFNTEEAVYWFAYSWHSGQWSNLYSALSTSPFSPGAIANGPESPADLLVQELECEYCGVPIPDEPLAEVDS